MADDPRVWLWHIQKASNAIARFTHNLDQDAYRADERTRAAVERKFEIIGEALNLLSRNSPDMAQRIPDLPHIVAFRNLLIHGYAIVDDTIVWQNIQQKLPQLAAKVDQILDELDGPDE